MTILEAIISTLGLFLKAIPAFFKSKTGANQANIIDEKIAEMSDSELDADADKFMRK